MDKVVALIQGEMDAVEDRFKQHLSSDVPLINQVGEYVLTSGGKRIRPMLLILAAKLCNYSGKDHIEMAGVVEFIHTATLLHDDVVDSAELRRGNRSANTVWGNQTSVLVGDFLFAKTFSIMVGVGNLEILRLLSETTTRMAEGEVQQLLNTCDLEVDEERYLGVIRSKTAILIAAACEVGAVLAGASPESVAALREFGLEIGTAFQLMDDALDYVAEEEAFGKAKGHDLEEGKMTLPLICAYAQADEMQRAEVSRIVEEEDISDADLDYVCGLIAAKDGIAYTRNKAAERVALAKQQLAVFPQCATRDALFELADYVVARKM